MLFRLLIVVVAVAQGFSLAPAAGARAVVARSTVTPTVEVIMGAKKVVKKAPKKVVKKPVKKVVKKVVKKPVKKVVKKAAAGKSFAMKQRESKGNPVNEIFGLVGEFGKALGALGK